MPSASAMPSRCRNLRLASMRIRFTTRFAALVTTSLTSARLAAVMRARTGTSAFGVPDLLAGALGLLDAPFLRVVELAGVPQLGEGLQVIRYPGADGALALGLGVELGAEQDRDVRDPQPDQEDDHGGERAVGLVVGA